MKQSIAFAKKIARILVEKKAEDIRIIDVRKLSGVTDFFIFATASSTVHNRALSEEIKIRVKGDWKLHHLEGVEGGDWVLMDFVDVIVHLFLPEMREFYDLERLWGDAKQVKYT